MPGRIVRKGGILLKNRPRKAGPRGAPGILLSNGPAPPRVDKQFAFAVILILLGFGLTQAGGEDEPFLAGLGFGLVVIASVWIAVRIVREYRGR